MSDSHDAFGARATLAGPNGEVTYYKLEALARQGISGVDRLPVTVKVFLENALRNVGNVTTEDDVRALAAWSPKGPAGREFPYFPGRVVMQDFTGVPCVVDLVAMRSAAKRMGGDPERINPLVPVDLVIDHSVQVDVSGSRNAYEANVVREYERNGERYALLRWAQKAFSNLRVVPPGTGIVHQVNLEFLANVVTTREVGGRLVAFPDTLVGTDSHTTMINGLGVVGWGVGGIEAEAVMLGQPLYLLTPEVIGFRFIGSLPEGATATDLVLTVTEMLRKHGVVGKFVEYTGPGLSALSLADRATIANMAPEYGATMGFFPVDAETLRYLRGTGRSEDVVSLVERYTKEQGLFRTDETPDPVFNELLELDLSTVVPSVAGPRRPQDRLALSNVQSNLHDTFVQQFVQHAPPVNGNSLARFDYEGGTADNQQQTEPERAVAPEPVSARVTIGDASAEMHHGSVAIAAITSCTNTSNPSVMLGAGILAKKAVERGLAVKPYVKTSLAPGSRAVTDYLANAGLTEYLEALGFYLVGYGCTTCIGNSGPLAQPVEDAIRENDLVAAAVLSGNRNFEGRISPLTKAMYLASPPLVVAYALAGTVDIDLTSEPLGNGSDGQPVYLRDIWPSQGEVRDAIAASLSPEIFTRNYAIVTDGDEHWQKLPVPDGGLYEWDPTSTYIHEPPFFQGLAPEPGALQDIEGARVLAMLADSVTTDHISPAGNIAKDSPAGHYLLEHGVQPLDFNQYGTRRGNDEVMVRGTFASIRLRNELAGGREGGWTAHQPDGEIVSIFDASNKYREEGVPLLVIAGKEYGSGSSRDWAAKGTLLLGVRAVIAESYERIHRSNLVGMGVLALQFLPGEGRKSIGLDGTETYSLEGIAGDLKPGGQVTVHAKRDDGSVKTFKTTVRIDSPIEVEYYRHGGILPMVLRKLFGGRA
ncbi:MAG: aconitate hydratase 1 [Chloroflexi bacterium]|nr:aconitate hydratase 1 [Chloroflexota bacterium]MDB5074189.1 aconitate hydratase 1 [Chloroflexota bacterium]